MICYFVGCLKPFQLLLYRRAGNFARASGVNSAACRVCSLRGVRKWLRLCLDIQQEFEASYLSEVICWSGTILLYSIV